ncbi:MAG: phosphatase PAP2 family protein [bacterium]
MGTTEESDVRRQAREWSLVVLFGIVALIACAKVGEDVFHHETAGLDRFVQSWVLAHQSTFLYSAFYWITTLGSVSPMVGYAILGSLLLWRNGRRHVASAVLLAPAAAVGTYLGVKDVFRRTRPSVAGLLEGTSSFPSAHATTSAAIALTLAYVFWREGQVSGAVAFAVSVLVPLLVGVSRVYLDVHWTTDVLGGWSVGLLIAVVSAALYNSVAGDMRQPAFRSEHSRSEANA